MSIAESMTSIADNIIASCNMCAKELGELVADSHQMLEKFAQERQQMSMAQAESLSNFVENLSKTVKSLLNGFHKDRMKNFEALKNELQEKAKEIKASVKNKLEEFHKAHSQMSEQQKEALSKNVKERVSEVKKILASYSDDMNKAASIWQNMTSTLAKARNGTKPALVEEKDEKAKSNGQKGGKKGKKKLMMW